ncbi:MAG: NADH-quinone oxidoreductase subunit C [Anaerolineae bacterium]|nr:NADH-quinone oxidoreductase subunit C [Anaerolineae bacterium]
MSNVKFNLEALLAAWQRAFPKLKLTMETLPLDEVVVAFPPEYLVPAVCVLTEQFNVRHLSTITGDDTGEGIALLYHFWSGSGLTLRTRLPYDALHIPSLTGIIPGAVFYEREAAEMLGVIFEGHPAPQPLLMPDDWEGEHPLRASAEDR